MACTFNVEIGKKQIDKQSGRIKESFLSVTHDGKLSCPKVQSPSSSNVENREKAKCETGLEKYYTKCQTRWKELSGPNSHRIICLDHFHFHFHISHRKWKLIQLVMLTYE